jgi:hypothetical protein
VVEFFDVLHLGIFVILSPGFDNRFYLTDNPPANILAELSHAIRHFYRLLHTFSRRFIIALEGEVVALSYVVDRMLAEFAAASVNFSRAIYESNMDVDVEDEGEDKGEEGITTSLFAERIEGILKESHPQIIPYYSNSLVSLHKHFTWTGPKLQILPRSQGILSIIPLITPGERLDLPSHPIYTIDSDPEPPSLPNVQPLIGKRREQADVANPPNEMPRKRIRVP